MSQRTWAPWSPDMALGWACRRASRLRCFTLGSLFKQFAYLFIRGLREIFIPDTDRAKRVRRSGADDLVHFFAELVASLMRGHGYRHDNGAGTLWSQGPAGSQH